MIFDAELERDLVEALRRLHGLRQRSGKRLAPASVELLRGLERSLAARSGQLLDVDAGGLDDAGMEPFMTSDEVRGVLRCGEKALRDMRRRGELPEVRVGRLVRFRRADVERLGR